MIGNVFEYLGNPSLGLYWQIHVKACQDLKIL